MEESMHTTERPRPAHALRRAAAAAILGACAGESALGPAGDAPSRAVSVAAAAGGARRGVELGASDRLRPPEGSVLAAHLYARGVQIYHWDGARWQFDGPSAALYADARFTGQVGTHSAGPVWVHAGGSTVYGSAPVTCVVDPDAIPWLLLHAAPDPTGGIFSRVTAIQRVNTTGGKMPVDAGAAPGEQRRVPYTAEYYFYR
jgi:hypothetical protein